MGEVERIGVGGGGGGGGREWGWERRGEKSKEWRERDEGRIEKDRVGVGGREERRC